MKLKLRVLALAGASALACGTRPTSGTGTCGPDSNVASDAQNCGSCGHVCPKPLHAAASCDAAICGRGPCDAGWADLDPAVLGCETECQRGPCGAEDGALPSTGVVFSTFASGSSYGDQFQTSRDHNNWAVLGEPTPATEDNAVRQASDRHQNIPGFGAVLHGGME